jgi:hypothetical protein
MELWKSKWQMDWLKTENVKPKYSFKTNGMEILLLILSKPTM